MAQACSKILLFGEHFVVYGAECIAVPVKKYINCTISPSSEDTIFRDQILKETTYITSTSKNKKSQLIHLIMERLNLKGHFNISIQGDITPSAGMGSSAALSISMIKEFSKFLDTEFQTSQLNELAFECERIFHGTPSGIDNTVIVYERPIKFKNSGTVKEFKPVEILKPLKIALINSGKRGGTKEMIQKVKALLDKNPQLKNELLLKIDTIVASAEFALSTGDVAGLGTLINQNQLLLKKIGVSTPNIDEICNLALKNGCYGAKLAGSGGGGMVITLLSEEEKELQTFFNELKLNNFPFITTIIEAT